MKEELRFWKKTTIKGFVTAGLTFFSICATIGWNSALEPSIVAAGIYIFAEAIKYYNIQPEKKVNKGTYTFIL